MQRANENTIVRRSVLRRMFYVFIALSCFANASSVCCAAISVGPLSKDKAKEKYGITMHARSNGDAGIKVWLEFKQEGWLEKFTYAELVMTDENGKRLISAMLKPNPVHHGQANILTTVAFSADASQLAHCHFLVVCYGSNEGDVGYTLAVKDYLDLKDPITNK